MHWLHMLARWAMLCVHIPHIDHLLKICDQRYVLIVHWFNIQCQMCRWLLEKGSILLKFHTNFYFKNTSLELFDDDKTDVLATSDAPIVVKWSNFGVNGRFQLQGYHVKQYFFPGYITPALAAVTVWQMAPPVMTSPGMTLPFCDRRWGYISLQILIELLIY